MVALALNPLAVEFCPSGSPPGLMDAMSMASGPPGFHAVAEDFSPPPGLMAPPGLEFPPGLSSPSCPPGLLNLVDDSECEEVDEQETKILAAPPGKFAPPGNLALACPPGVLAPVGPPGFFAPSYISPLGVWAKDSDDVSNYDLSTDAESDSESSLDGSFSE